METVHDAGMGEAQAPDMRDHEAGAAADALEPDEVSPEEGEPETESVPGQPSAATREEHPVGDEVVAAETPIPVSVAEDTGEDDRWEAFFRQLLRADDLAGAYWLAVSLEAGGHRLSAAGWLVEAVFASRWLAMDSSRFVDDLLRIVRLGQPGETDVEELLALAAALRPAVIAPFSGTMGWLKVPRGVPALKPLVDAVRAFANLGRPLRKADLLGLADAREYDEIMGKSSDEARQWLDEAQHRRTKLGRATNVWTDLVGWRGELRAFLQHVADDRRHDVDDVRRQANQWLDRDYVQRRVMEIDRKNVGMKVSPITADPLDQITRLVRDGCDLALRWCELVERDAERKTRGQDWLAGHIEALVTGVRAAMTDVASAIAALRNGNDARAAAASCLAGSLAQFYVDLGLAEGSGAGTGEWTWLGDNVEEIAGALAKRLLFLPGVGLDDFGKPTALEGIANALRDFQANPLALAEILDQWLKNNDYRFMPVLLGAVRNEDERVSLARRYEEELNGARVALEEEIRRTTDFVEQAVVDGILSNEERAEHLGRFVNTDPHVALNYRHHYAVLEGVRLSVDDARHRRLEELRGEWGHLRRRLAEYPGEEAKKTGIIASVENALQRNDTRVVEECIAQLGELLDSGEVLQDNPLSLASSEDTPRRFMETSNRLGELLSKGGLDGLQDARKQGRPWGGINFAEFPPPSREERLAAVGAWRRLKQGMPGSPGNETNIVVVLRCLGFHIDQSLDAAVTSKKKGEHWVHLRVAMSAGGLSSISQFGSHQQGVCDVFCLWERSNVDALVGWARDLRLDNRNIIVLYLGRMGLSRRGTMRQVTSERGLGVVVLDEILLAFLAGEQGERLPVFFRSALPFAAINPYFLSNSQILAINGGSEDPGDDGGLPAGPYFPSSKRTRVRN